MTPLEPLPLLVSSGACWPLPLREIVALVTESGADGIELLVGPELSGAPERTVARAFEGYAGTRYLHAPFGLMDAAPGERTGLIESSVRLARGIGARLVVLHPPRDETGRYRPRVLRQMVEGFRAGLDAGVEITLENLPKTDAKRGGSVSGSGREHFDRLAALAEELGVGLTLDTTHLGSWRMSPTTTHRRHAGLVRHVHLSDFAGGEEHMVPGRGDMPLGDYLRYLARLPEAVSVTVEVYHGGDAFTAARAAEHVRHALRFARRALAAGL